jgi:microcystin degradation protein MlrC
LLADLRAALPVDMVLLALHGAMMAEGYPDCEGDILGKVRDIVGAAVPVGAILDLHGNVTPEMVATGAVLTACKEYPHTDYRPRTEEIYAILADAARGGVMPRTTLRRVPVLTLSGTTEPPMRDFVADLRAAEGRDGILAVSMMHGFPWSDMAHTGAAVLIVSDESVPLMSSALSDRFAAAFVRIAVGAPISRLGVEEAVVEALQLAGVGGPVVIADSSDNPGGGAACDSTFLLRALLDRGVRDAALGMIWDPQAAMIAADAGVGARLPIRIGGKVGPLSGMPIDAEAEILAVRDDVCQRGLGGELSDALGLAVALRIGGVEIVVNSIRQQVFSPECFTGLGIDLAGKQIVVVKSSQHFRAGFDPIARAVIYCDAPGSLNMDLASLPYQRLSRPTWPLDRLSMPVF